MADLPPLRREVAYVSGPYRAPTPAGIWAHIMRARDVAADLWRMGYIAICPHTNTMLMDGIRPDHDWLAGDLEILRRCDLVVLVPEWRDSQGARAEVAEAKRLRIPVYEWAGSGDIRPLASIVNTATDSPIGESVGELRPAQAINRSRPRRPPRRPPRRCHPR